MLYGFIFIGAFIGYYLNPSIGYVFAITIILRLFEYGINKPTREVVFSYLKRTDRYKSTVLLILSWLEWEIFQVVVLLFLKVIWVGIFTSTIISNSICWMFGFLRIKNSSKREIRILKTSSFTQSFLCKF